MNNKFSEKFKHDWKRINRGFERKQIGDITYVYAKSLFDAGALHGLTTRHGGVSVGDKLGSLNLGFSRPDDRKNIIENYLRLARAAGFDYDSMAIINFQHGNGVEIATRKDRGRGFNEEMNHFPFCDALIAKEKGVTLITSHADCLPVFLFDPISKAFSGIHAGWKGTSLRIGVKAAKKMIESCGAKVDQILAAIGPSLSQAHFEVDEPVHTYFSDAFPNTETSYFDDKTKKYHIDLRKIMVAQLIEANILPENITLCETCTFDNPQDYYSYRRDREGYGSMAGFICLR